MGGPVGDAYIEVGAEDDTDADLAKISKKLVKELSRASREAGKEMIDQFSKSADKAGNSMLRHLQDDFRKVRKEIKDLSKGEKIQLEAELSAAAVKAELLWIARDRVVTFWANVKGNAAAELTAIAKGLSGINMITAWKDAVIAMGTSLPQTILRFGLLGGAITSLITPLLNAVSAIGPLGASLGKIFPIVLAFPAAFAAMGAGIGVIVSAFKDLEGATTSSGKQANKLLKDLKKQFSTLQNVIQGNFWDGFIGPLQGLVKNLMPQLEAGLAGLATAMGAQFGEAASAISNQLGSSGLKDLFANMEAGVNNASSGLAAFAAAFTRIMEQGSTLLPQFGTWLTEIGTSFNNWAQGADIAGLIQSAATQMGHLFNVGKEAWGVISGIFTAMDTGKSTGLESLAATLGKISDVVNGPGFQVAMQTVFIGAAQGAEALAKALDPIGDSLAILAPTIANLLSKLSGGFADALTGIIGALSAPVATEGLNAAINGLSGLLSGINWASFAPIIGAIGQTIGTLTPLITNLVNALLPFLPPIITGLQEVGGVLLGLLPPVLNLLQPLIEMPGLVSGIVAAFLAFKGVSAIMTGVRAAMMTYQAVLVGVQAAQAGLTLATDASKASIIGFAATTIAQSVKAAAIWVANMVQMGASAVAQAAVATGAWIASSARTVAALAAQAAAFVAQKAVLVAMQVATAAATAAQWLLNAAMSANPIGLIIAAVTALVAALIWFFTQTDLGREIWANFVSFITDVWNGFVTWITGVIDGFLAWWNATWTAVSTFFSDAWNGLVSFVTGLFQGYISWVMSIVDGFVSWWNGIWTAVGSFIQDVWNGFIGFVRALIVGWISYIYGQLNGFVSFWSGIWKNVSNAAKDIWNGVIDFFKSIPDKIKGVFTGAAKWLYDIGKDIVQGLWNGLKAIWKNVTNWFKDAFDGLVGGVKGLLGIHSPSRVFEGIGDNITQGLVNGLGGMEEAAGKAISGALKPIMSSLQMDVSGMTPTTGTSSSSVNNYDQRSTTSYEKGAFALSGPDPYKIAREVANISAENSSL